MQKVIVERPRWGSRMRNYKSGGRLTPAQVRSAIQGGEDYDDGGARARSFTRKKSLNENLAPLRRYLGAQVGRPWNKVFHEIRQNVDTRSAIGLHVMQHLFDYVAIDTTLRGGVVYEIRRFWGARPVQGLYVHPVTGILRTTERRRRS